MAVNNSLVNRQTKTGLAAYLTQDAVKKQINSIVGGKNGTRFISSIVSAVQTTPALQECTNPSILSAIYFQKLTPGEYDPATGNYGEDTISEDMKSASVMDTGTNTMMLVYSGIKEGSLTIHLQNHYDKPFDRIRVGNKTYGVDFSRKLRTKQVYVASEVM